MRIMIVDDEPPARDELRFLIEPHWPEAEYFTAASGAEAIDLAKKSPLDVVFLDINMPGGNGLEVASFLNSQDLPPQIVFATAYSQHAVEAFELSAIDYLVKPYDERRLAKTVVRINERVEQPGKQKDSIEEYLSGQLAQTIWSESDSGEKVLLNYQEIAYVEADRKKIYAVRQDGLRTRLKPTLKELEASLGEGFLRIHKGYLVNLSFIGSVQRWYSGGYSLKLSDAKESELQVSRRFASSFKEKTGLV